MNTATHYIVCLTNQIIQNENNLIIFYYNLVIMYRQILAGDLAFLPLSAYVYDPTYIGPQYKIVRMSIHRTLPVRKGKTQGVKI